MKKNKGKVFNITCFLLLVTSIQLVFAGWPVKWVDGFGPWTTDASSAIQAAISSLPSTGGTIQFGDGKYPVMQTIIIPSNVIVEGQGWGSIITGMTEKPIFQTANNAQNVVIRDLIVEFNNSLSSGSSFQIEGINSIGLKISNVRFDAPIGRSHAGFRDWNGNLTAAKTPNMARIESCIFRQGQIWLSASEAGVYKNFIWASEQNSLLAFAIRLDGNANGAQIEGNDIVAAGSTANLGSGEVEGGIVCYGVNSIRIVNNYFDGSWSLVQTHNPIFGSTLYHSIISENVFWNNCTGAIYLLQPHHVGIINNIFLDNNRNNSNTNDDIKIISDAWKSNGIMIQNNNHFQTNTRTNAARALNVSGIFGSRCQINGNTAAAQNGQGFRVPAFGVFSRLGVASHAEVEDRSESSLATNRSGIYLNNSSGSFVRANNSNPVTTRVTFVKAFEVTPRYDEINVQIVTADPTITSFNYSIANISKTGFDIITSMVAGQSAVATVNWSCDIK